MFEIRETEPGRVELIGRLDATHELTAETFLDEIETSTKVDCSQLKYIASNGLGLLFAAQKRLSDVGAGLTLINLSPHIREVFRLAGFDTIFVIESES